MIVYSREYDSDTESKAEFDRFAAWSSEVAAKEVSAWRTQYGPKAGPEVFQIVVVDESDEQLTLGFDWHGRLVPLDVRQAAAFVERRVERIAAGYLGGERERLTERIHYGVAAAPRLDGEGVWHYPPPRQG